MKLIEEDNGLKDLGVALKKLEKDRRDSSVVNDGGFGRQLRYLLSSRWMQTSIGEYWGR